MDASMASQSFDLQSVITKEGSVTELLARAAREDPDQVYAVEWTGAQITRLGLLELVRAASTSLETAGVGRDSRVAIGLPNSLVHIAIVFAVLRVGALWVPLNTKLRGGSLQHQLRDSGATHLVAEPDGELINELMQAADGQIAPVSAAQINVASDMGAPPATAWTLGDRCFPRQAPGTLPDSVVAFMYTSGTTGPAKGVQITDSMLIASVAGVVAASEPQSGDVFYVWEPLFHIGGAQLMILPLITPVRLAISARLTVSRFWDEAAALGATHIHHLGGVLQMLLNRTPSPAEQAHSVRISWGAGATPEIWEVAQRRFGLTIHECYGLTEVSSIVTVNKSGPQDGIGRPLPWFQTTLAPGTSDDCGELLVRSTIPGVITPGYLNRPDATAFAQSDGWWRTGDLVRRSNDGSCHFLGRITDSIRVRGENVSAWEVEKVFSAHPGVDQCAAVGVQAEIGEQEIMLFVVPANGAALEPAELVRWAAQRMASFQVPRYLRLMNELPMTPSRRVSKKRLPTSLEGAFDVGDVISK